MRNSEVLQGPEIPDFEQVLRRFENDYAHIFSLDGGRMRKALKEAYQVAANYKRGNLSEEELDRGLAGLVSEYPELESTSRQAKGYAYTAVMMKLVTGESLTDLE